MRYFILKSIGILSRNPKRVNETDQPMSSDLIALDNYSHLVEGSEVVYLTIGLPYKTATWQEHWPKVMKKTIEACKKHNAKLVFFDNIYMLDPKYIGCMKEDTPVNPSSKKGKVRAYIAQMILNEIESGNLKALIARSADFYGPEINNSVLLETVYKKLKNGKKANWFCSLNYKHSFTYTPDAAEATALLGNSEEAYGQIWHLPTAPDPLTMREWINTLALQMDVKPKVMVANKFMIKIIGLFNPIMKEFVEMLYQYDRDYVFDSNKFHEHFNFDTTPYLEGIKKIITNQQ